MVPESAKINGGLSPGTVYVSFRLELDVVAVGWQGRVLLGGRAFRVGAALGLFRFGMLLAGSGHLVSIGAFLTMHMFLLNH